MLAIQTAGGATIGAIDPRLAEIIEAWPALSDAQRAELLAIMRNAKVCSVTGEK